MSLGGGYTPQYEDIGNMLKQAGVLLVASAGNGELSAVTGVVRNHEANARCTPVTQLSVQSSTAVHAPVHACTYHSGTKPYVA